MVLIGSETDRRHLLGNSHEDPDFITLEYTLGSLFIKYDCGYNYDMDPKVLKAVPEDPNNENIVFYHTQYDKFKFMKVTADRIKISSRNHRGISHLGKSIAHTKDPGFLTFNDINDLTLINHSMAKDVDITEDLNFGKYLKKYLCQKQCEIVLSRKYIENIPCFKYQLIAETSDLDRAHINFRPSVSHLVLAPKELSVTFVKASKYYLSKAVQFLHRIPAAQKMSVQLNFAKSTNSLAELLEAVFAKRLVGLYWRYIGGTNKGK